MTLSKCKMFSQANQIAQNTRKAKKKICVFPVSSPEKIG